MKPIETQQTDYMTANKLNVGDEVQKAVYNEKTETCTALFGKIIETEKGFEVELPMTTESVPKEKLSIFGFKK